MIDLRRLAPAFVLLLAACSAQPSPISPTEVRPREAIPAPSPVVSCWPDGCSGFPGPAAGPLAPSTSWGGLWSVAGGVAVLRPTWLPEDAARETFWRAVTTDRWGLAYYRVSYVGRHEPDYPDGREWITGRRFTFITETVVQPTPFVRPDFWFVDGIASNPAPGSAATEAVAVRGRSGEIITRDHPYVGQWSLQLSWTENGYRYAIQASFRSSRDELVHIADSMLAMTDATSEMGAAPRTDGGV